MGRRPDAAAATGWRTRPVIRAGVAMGPTRILRVVVTLLFLGAWLLVIGVARPDLGRPVDIGTDASNYLAAGQRLAEHHSLYALTASDRPVPADNPPYFSAPLLSPPPIAVLWRWLSLLPAAAAIYAWWLGGVALTAVAAAVVVLRAPGAGLLVAAPLAVGIAIVGWSGNVNAYLLPLTMVVWQFSEGRSSRARWLAAAGGLAMLGAMVKLTPVFLLWWLVCRRRFAAVGGALGAGLVFGVIALATAGLEPFIDYLRVGRATAAVGATTISPTGVLELLGVSRNVASLAPLIVGAFVALLLYLLRSRPRASFAVSIAGVVFASPVVRYESLALLLAALTPWLAARSAPARSAVSMDPATGRARLEGLLRRRSTASMIAAVSVLPLVGGVLLAPQAGSSGERIFNASAELVVVRFVNFGSGASFGFEVPAYSAGTGWSDAVGGLDGLVVVLDGECRFIGRAQPSQGNSTITVASEGSVVADHRPWSSPAPVPLAYTSRCASEVDPSPDS